MNTKLASSEDAGDSVRLYFKLTKYGTSDPTYHLAGEGMVQLQKGQGGWEVTSYTSYF
jgi:hypothetical protein